MSMATLLVLGAAVLATLALAAWAWVWFAIWHQPPPIVSPFAFDGVDFEKPACVAYRFLPFSQP